MPKRDPVDVGNELIEGSWRRLQLWFLRRLCQLGWHKYREPVRMVCGMVKFQGWELVRKNGELMEYDVRQCSICGDIDAQERQDRAGEVGDNDRD